MLKRRKDKGMGKRERERERCVVKQRRKTYIIKETQKGRESKRGRRGFRSGVPREYI
jgi:hypothetical protein